MVEWFAYTSVFNPELVDYVKLPQGPVCKTDGSCCEVWPRLSIEEVQHKLETDTEFKKFYWAVRKGVSIAEDRARKDIVFMNNKSCVGQFLSLRMAELPRNNSCWIRFEACLRLLLALLRGAQARTSNIEQSSVKLNTE